MFHICLQFNHPESYCESLICMLKKHLPEQEIHHGPTKGLFEGLTGTHSIWLDVKDNHNFYLAYGFLSVYGGIKGSATEYQVG